jgi:hypothetical protein
MRKQPPRPQQTDELEEFKRFLGPIATEYTDAQLLQLRREMHAMAGLLLDVYLSGKQGRKGIDSLPSGATLKAERSKKKISLG